MSNVTHKLELSSFVALLPRIRFDREVIVDLLQNITTSNPSFLNNPLIFYRDPLTGILQNELSGSPIILLHICTAITGTGLFNLYNGAAARILTWLVPTLLLMTGIQYAPSGWRKFATIPHLLGDPIDSVWSLLSKVETVNRCLIMAERLTEQGSDSERTQNTGLIISCIEELFSTGTYKAKNYARRREEVGTCFGKLELAPDVLQDKIRSTQMDGIVSKAEQADKKGQDLSSVTIREVEIFPNVPPTSSSPDIFTIDRTPFCSCTHPSLDTLYARTAQRILDSRVSSVRQTIFSICAYIVLGIVAAFVPQFGGNPNPSGGKIVTFILLSWLLPTILLSNLVGQFNTSRSCLDAVTTFRTELERLTDEERGLCSIHACGGGRTRRWIKIMETVDWGSAQCRIAVEMQSLYSFRLLKQCPVLDRNFTSKTTTLHSNRKLVLLSFLPVTISFIAAFIVLWSAPTYFSCRHIMIICIYTTWILSFLFTKLLSLSPSPSPASSPSSRVSTRFNLILTKDILLSTAIIGILVASASGLFNSCFCWSGWWYLHYWTEEPQVQLNPSRVFGENNRWVYPVVVGVCMGLQGVWFVGMMWVGRRYILGGGGMRSGCGGAWSMRG